MNDKDILMEKDAEQEQLAPVSHRKPYGPVIAAVVCLLLALVVWVGVMNTQDTDYISIRLVAPDGYTCELSATGVEVEGSVGVLRGLKEIVVPISTEDAEYILYYYDGEAAVNEAFLQLPLDVSLTREWTAKLTVTKN